MASTNADSVAGVWENWGSLDKCGGQWKMDVTISFYVQTVVNYVTVTCFLLSWYMVGRVSTVKSNQVFYRVIYNSNSHKKKNIYIYI